MSLSLMSESEGEHLGIDIFLEFYSNCNNYSPDYIMKIF
jgi:hypothetical protein